MVGHGIQVAIHGLGVIISRVAIVNKGGAGPCTWPAAPESDGQRGYKENPHDKVSPVEGIATIRVEQAVPTWLPLIPIWCIVVFLGWG